MLSDNQLIQNTLEGDSVAFRSLVIRYQDKMYSVCLSILKNRAEAQEAAQDTFIKMHRALKDYKADAKFSSWLYKIAYRTSLDYIRKRKNTSDLDHVNQSELKASENRAESFENRELSKLLDQLIQELPDDEAGLIKMFYLEEMSIKELEEITGLSKSNVKVKLFRARKRLSEMIQEQQTEFEAFLN